MLERFAAAKAAEIASLRLLAGEDRLPEPFAGPRPALAAALRQVRPGRCAVIAEYKRASPSKGIINESLSAADVAGQYASAGASALSILTESDHFQGRMEFLFQAREAAPGLPLLRKDFILDPLQVAATAATPASALLLVARMLPGPRLAGLLAACAAHGLEAVTEVFDAADLASARAAGATLIQVNNRDLDTLGVSLDVSRGLAPSKAPGETWISASGISHGDQVRELAELGFEAVLVGTSLMQDARPGAALARLIAEAGE